MNAAQIYEVYDSTGRPLSLNIHMKLPTKKGWCKLNVPLRRSSKRITASHSIAGPQLSGIFKLITIVALFCDWPTLIQLGNCNIYLRSVCQQVMRSYIQEFVSSHIGKANLRRFFDILTTTKSVITGGVVHAMLCASFVDIYRTVRPIQLELVVPKRDGRALAIFKRFFFPLGFKVMANLNPCVSVAHLATRIVTFEREFDGLRISLLEASSNDVLPIILSANHTSGMDVLTSSRIYCFYPTLLEKGENMVMGPNRYPYRINYEDGFWPFNFGLRTYRSTEDWMLQRHLCGDQCPALWRTAKGLPGVQIMRWGGIDSEKDNGKIVSESDGFEQSDLIWSMNGACGNIFCPNYKRGGAFYDLL